MCEPGFRASQLQGPGCCSTLTIPACLSASSGTGTLLHIIHHVVPYELFHACYCLHRRFQCQLARLQQRKPAGWFVIYHDTAAGLYQKITADFVVIATGIYMLPNVPTYQVSN